MVDVGSESSSVWHPAEDTSAAGGTSSLILALSICLDHWGAAID